MTLLNTGSTGSKFGEYGGRKITLACAWSSIKWKQSPMMDNASVHHWFKGINTGIKHSLTNFSNLLPFSIPSAKNTSCTPSEDTTGTAEYHTPLINILWSTGGMPLRLHAPKLPCTVLSITSTFICPHKHCWVIHGDFSHELYLQVIYLCIATWRITCLYYIPWTWVFEFYRWLAHTHCDAKHL